MKSLHFNKIGKRWGWQLKSSNGRTLVLQAPPDGFSSFRGAWDNFTEVASAVMLATPAEKPTPQKPIRWIEGPDGKIQFKIYRDQNVPKRDA